jgi:S-adenosylmethionine/arginine decarboxylase-like enzyme
MKLQIHHLHILIRAECNLSPKQKDVKKISKKVVSLIKDINMNVFMTPRVKYMPDEGNEGLTWVAGLETSHCSFHAWDKPDQDFMKYPDATLHQMDLYTCGCMNTAEVKTILEFLSEYEPLQVNCVIFDRSKTLVKPAVKLRYNYETNKNYDRWLKKLKIKYLDSFKPEV